MTDSDVELLNTLAHEFTERLRHGDQPVVSEYVDKHPQLAAQIEDLFPTLALVEAELVRAQPSLSHKTLRPADLPKSIGQYHILRELGRGGMGIVYEAVQETLGRHVALKVLTTSLSADARQLARFHRESRAVARLHHKSIVPVFDVGEADGLHFFVMQFIEGIPLNQVTGVATHHQGTRSIPAQGKERFRQIADIGKQVSEALAYAHGEGVLHRDVKPGNVLLDARGVAWVTDFGLARIEGLDELSTPGDVVGTLRYLSPERLEGHVDERGDVYGLGITLYELLTSQPAFTASSHATLVHRILNSSPTAPRHIDPSIPRDLETIVLKAMARDPSQRYPRADALAADLNHFLTGQPILARRNNPWEQTRLWCVRNKALATMITVAAALFVALFALLIVDSIKLRNQLDQTQTAQRDGRRHLFESLLSQAHALANSGRAGQRFETLRVLDQARRIAVELQLGAEITQRLRNETIAALCLPDIELDREIDAWLPDTRMVDFDRHVNRYARGDDTGTLTIHRVVDGTSLLRLPSPGPGWRIANDGDAVFSPDGRYGLQICRAPEKTTRWLRLWDLDADPPRVVLDVPAALGASFRPNGREIAVSVVDTASEEDTSSESISIHVYDIPSGDDRIVPIPVRAPGEPAFHPTDSKLAIAEERAVRIVDLDTGSDVGRWEQPDLRHLTWSHQGRLLFAASDTDLLIHRWNVTGQRSLSPLEGHTRPGITLALNQVGDLLVSNDSSMNIRLWDSHTGRLLMTATGGTLPNMRFSADDRWLGPEVGTGVKLRMNRFAGARLLRRFSADPRCEVWFPKTLVGMDGRLLVTASRDKTLFFDLARSEPIAEVLGVRRPLLFEPSGALVTHADLPEGVARWPLRVDADGSGRVVLGPPRRLILAANVEGRPAGMSATATEDSSASADGRVIAVPAGDQGTYLFVADQAHADPEKYRRMTFGPQNDVGFCSVSPDGRWVAAGSRWWPQPAFRSVTVWDVWTGRRIRDLASVGGLPRFSGDGRWLAVQIASNSAEQGRLWKVGSWEPGRILDDYFVHIAFDRDSRLLAVPIGYGQVRLLAPETGREITRLTVPDQTRLAPECFTPNGSLLIACGIDNGQVYVWDLPAIRGELTARGLDWDAPPYDVPAASELPPPLQFEIRGI